MPSGVFKDRACSLKVLGQRDTLFRVCGVKHHPPQPSFRTSVVLCAAIDGKGLVWWCCARTKSEALCASLYSTTKVSVRRCKSRTESYTVTLSPLIRLESLASSVNLANLYRRHASDALGIGATLPQVKADSPTRQGNAQKKITPYL